MDVFSVLLFRSKPNTVAIHATTFGGRAVGTKKPFAFMIILSGLALAVSVVFDGTAEADPRARKFQQPAASILISGRASKKASLDIAMLDSYHTPHEGKRGRC